MSCTDFFEESREQSLVKTRIVSKYFWAWAKVIISVTKSRERRIAYVDLFAGPGRYGNGTKSTPLLILQTAIENPDFSQRLVSVFNDKDERHTRELETAIKELPDVGMLKYEPRVSHEDVASEQLVKEFESTKLVPTLFFVDPWGYKGLSLKLVNSVLKDWGCDCIFFFNYNRINAGLSNPVVQRHMDALFRKDRADKLRTAIKGLKPRNREKCIVRELRSALGAHEGRYVLPFRFLNESGTRATHYLFFVSKNELAYEIMKGIMAMESSSFPQDVPSFEHCPGDTRSPVLIDLDKPLDELEEKLLAYFAGKNRTRTDIYRQHEKHIQQSLDRPYLERNYTSALINLEARGVIQCDPPVNAKRVRKMGPGVRITFPMQRPKRVA